MIENNDILESKSIIDMLTVANEFCHFTENIRSYSYEEILNFYIKILPLLYLKGTLLPEIENNEEYPSERFVVESDWEMVFESLKDILGKKDEFYSYYDYNTDQNATKSSISEHIADIYQDLKDFILLYSEGLSYKKQNAIADCKELFISNWGVRICNLLPILHELCFL